MRSDKLRALRQRAAAALRARTKPAVRGMLEKARGLIRAEAWGQAGDILRVYERLALWSHAPEERREAARLLKDIGERGTGLAVRAYLHHQLGDSEEAREQFVNARAILGDTHEIIVKLRRILFNAA